MTVAQIDSLPADASFDRVFNDYVSTATPLVLRQAALGWPCRTRWTPDFFVQHYGAVLVDFWNTRTRIREQRPLSAYFELDAAIRSEWYLVDWDFRRRHPQLLADICIPPQFDVDWVSAIPEQQRPDLMWIYIGHAGTRGAIHIDNFGSSAWLAVLSGRKRVRFLTQQTLSIAQTRGLDLFAPEAAMQNAVHEACLDPGDVVFVPAGCWHAANNDTDCISLTANFIDGANFTAHRTFETRRWHGRRMLVTQLNYLDEMAPGPARERLQRHLTLAMDRLHACIAGELAELARFRQVLDETMAEPAQATTYMRRE